MLLVHDTQRNLLLTSLLTVTPPIITDDQLFHCVFCRCHRTPPSASGFYQFQLFSEAPSMSVSMLGSIQVTYQKNHDGPHSRRGPENPESRGFGSLGNPRSGWPFYVILLPLGVKISCGPSPSRLGPVYADILKVHGRRLARLLITSTICLYLNSISSVAAL